LASFKSRFGLGCVFLLFARFLVDFEHTADT